MGIFAGSKLARANAGLGNTTTVGQYTVHIFSTVGNTTFTPASTGLIDILAIGGGGGAGYSVPPSSPMVSAGGGGAGATVFRKFVPVIAGTPYPVGVGTGGVKTTSPGAIPPPLILGTNGGSTFFNAPGVGISSITAAGGGLGGSAGLYPWGTSTPGNPSPNASGGGGGGTYVGTPPIPTQPGGIGANVYGIGYDGSSNSGYLGGGGGGAGGLSSPTTSGGPGVPITYFTGTSTPSDTVCVGGGQEKSIPYPTSYGNGGNVLFPTTGIGSNTPGNPGALYIRYI